MVLLQRCRWTFSHKNFVSDFIRLNVNFIHNNDKFVKLVSSQSTRVTDRQTELRLQDSASIAASRGKIS